VKLLYVADGRSPIARSWIGYFISAGHEVHLISTRPAPELPDLQSLSVVPVAFSGVARTPAAAVSTGAGTIGLRTWLRHWFGPLSVARAGRQVRSIVNRLQPDLVHGLRIPFEAAVAAAAESRPPLIVSIWGNDLTLHAPSSPTMRRMTRRTLRQAVGLHTDCQRDQRLAPAWGFDPDWPTLVAPGNGGVRLTIFHPGAPGEPQHNQLAGLLRSLPDNAPVVVNPRGFRAYLRNDSFFRSVPLILKEHPRTHFLCPAMAGETQAVRLAEASGRPDSIHLLPSLQPEDMAVVMRRAQVMVSPSEHDGTPNTLLEAMACGAFPVLGALESVAEWIEHGANGMLIDPGRPEPLAEAVSTALADEDLRSRAAAINQRLVADRAEYSACMTRADAFYREVLKG
jgi:glycosyltransferase involved in cell wall biosynthesis